MTTTELIRLLTEREFGGATGRPREISLYINDRLFIPEPEIKICGSGDGLFTTLELNITTDKDVRLYDPNEHTYFEQYEDGLFCYECGQSFPKNEFKTYAKYFRHCPNCGRKVTRINLDGPDVENTTQSTDIQLTSIQIKKLIQLVQKAAENCMLIWNENQMDWEWQYASEAKKLLAEISNNSVQEEE